MAVVRYCSTIIMVQGSPSLQMVPNMEKEGSQMRRASGHHGTCVCGAEHEGTGLIKLLGPKNA